MRIGELARRTGVSTRSLRYYEEQALLSPSRSGTSQRIFSAEHVGLVLTIQELFRCGFCSSVIRGLLPLMHDDGASTAALAREISAAQARLESEKAKIERELDGLDQLRARLGLAPDTHVKDEDREHDPHQIPEAAPPDHRDRRLR